MTLVSDTQQAQELIGKLRKPWASADPLDTHIDKVEWLLLSIANDRADAREMLDQEKIKSHQLQQIIDSLMNVEIDLRRKLQTIKMIACNMDAAAWVRMDAIKEIVRDI